MKNKVLITAALPYANGALHFGHIAGAYLPADAYARYCRLRGRDTLFICGSDEHGVAITLSAEKAGRSPQAHVDHYHKINGELFKKLGITFDHFSRTTWPKHADFTLQFFGDLLKNGYIAPQETEQLYSEADKRFLADRYVVGKCPKCGYEEARGDECPKCGASFEATELINPRSKISNQPLTLRKTTHWFLLLDKLKDKVGKWLHTKSWKEGVKHFSEGYLKEVHPRAITRDMEWGIPVPLKEAAGKVFYVWFDAPIGYISATVDWNQARWKDYWEDPKTHYVQFVGKDNVPFHAVIFPAMCMGQNQPYKLVDDLVVNEFYNLEGRQFSKSDNWTIDLEDFLKRYSADQIRYAIAANAPENGDSEFTWKDFQSRCNGELLGKLGNFINRVMVFAHANFNGKVLHSGTWAEASPVLNEFEHKVLEIADAYEHYHLRKATQILMQMAHIANSFIDEKKPWADKAGASNTIALALHMAKILAVVCRPLIPHTSERIWHMLNLPALISWDQGIKEVFTKTLNPSEILFHKIEDVQIEEEIKKLSGPESPFKAPIGIDEFDKVDLRVGQVISAEKLPKSKKLLKLQVDLGFEKRQILSGIALHAPPESLVGKKVVIVANLKPAKMMGEESQGMLLCIANEDRLEILGGGELPCGSVIQ